MSQSQYYAHNAASADKTKWRKTTTARSRTCDPERWPSHTRNAVELEAELPDDDAMPSWVRDAVLAVKGK